MICSGSILFLFWKNGVRNRKGKLRLYVNVNHFFRWYDKQIFMFFGNEFLHHCGKQIFMSGGKHFFT